MIDRKTLLEPPFMADPPVKLNISAKTLGLVLAILGGISAFFGLLAVFALLGVSALAAAYGGIFIVALLGLIVAEIGTVIGAWGGYQMYQGKQEGKLLAIYGLIINVVGSLLVTIGGHSGVVGWVFGALVSFVIYYLIVISKFPGEPAPVSAATPVV